MTQPKKQPLEATLQNLVSSVDTGLGLKIIRTTLFCLFFLGLSLIFTANQFRGFRTEAAMDYAQLGRKLAQSNRYITQCVRPVSMATVSAHRVDDDAQIGDHPELFKPPLYPAILAADFKFFNRIGMDLFPVSRMFEGGRIYPAEQWAIIPLNHFFTGLSGLLLYLLGRKLFSHKIGLLSVSAYFLSDMVWRDSLQATGLPVLVFFILGATYFALLAIIHRSEHKLRRNWLLLFGLSTLFSSAAVLTHYAAFAFIPGVALFIGIMGSRVQRNGHLAFLYLVLVFLLISPWLLRNVRLSGSPLGLAPHTALIHSADYPGDALMRTLKPTFGLLSDYRIAKAQWAKNFNELYGSGITSMGGGLLMSFFLVTFFYRFVRVPAHNLRWGIGLAMLLFSVGIVFFGKEALGLYHLFWPFVILYGLAFFFILLDRLHLDFQIHKSGLIALVMGLSALPLLVTLFGSAGPGNPYPPYYAPFIMRVSELLKPNEVMCTDMPWATAWYGQRTSILLPQTIDDYYEINDYHNYISGLYLTSLSKDRPFVSSLIDGSEKTWFPVMMGRLPEDFPLKQGFALNKQDQIFLTDSVRWGPDQTQRPIADTQKQPQK